MCEIGNERNRIEALLDRTISPFWFEDSRNSGALVEMACRCLYEETCDRCSDACIRSRCEAYVARRLGRFAVRMR
jgi:hypothetical protein